VELQEQSGKFLGPHPKQNPSSAQKPWYLELPKDDQFRAEAGKYISGAILPLQYKAGILWNKNIYLLSKWAFYRYSI